MWNVWLWQTRKSALADCTALLRVLNVKRASFLLEVGAFRPKFYGNRATPCQTVDTVRQVVDPALQLCRCKFLDNKTCLVTFNSFSSKFLRKTTNLHLNTILGKLGVTHDLGWWLVGKPIVNSVLAVNWTFSLSITVPELWGEMYTADCFRRRSTSLHSNFSWTGSSPINHSWHQKTRDTGLPDGEDRIPLRSLILTQYRSVTDIQTDGYMP